MLEFGAGDGNRTHAASLEGWNSTIELHPRNNSNIPNDNHENIKCQVLFQKFIAKKEKAASGIAGGFSDAPKGYVC